MPYLIDRGRAVLTATLVAITRGRQRRVRSQWILQDNSIYNTLTRPKTILEAVRQRRQGRATTLVWRAPQR